MENHVITSFEKGNKLYKGKLYSEALEEFKRAAELDLTHYNAHFCVAKTLVRLQRTEEGISYFQKYINLISQDKQASYVSALANILTEENRANRALFLLETVKDKLSTEESLSYIKALLANSQTKDAVHTIINFPSGDIPEVYKKLDAPDIGNIVEPFIELQLKETILKNYETSDDTYENAISETSKLLKSIQEDKNSNYAEEFEEIKIFILQAQESLYEKTKSRIETNVNLSKAKEGITILQKTGFDKDKISPLVNKLNNRQKAAQNKHLKKIMTIFGIVLLLGLSAFLGKTYWEDIKKMAGIGFDYENAIHELIKANNDKDLYQVMNHFSPYIEQFGKTEYPEPSFIENEYNNIWQNTPDLKINIKLIEKITDNVYDLYATYTFTKPSGETDEIPGKTRIVFDEDGKIIRYYEIE